MENVTKHFFAQLNYENLFYFLFVVAMKYCISFPHLSPSLPFLPPTINISALLLVYLPPGIQVVGPLSVPEVTLWWFSQEVQDETKEKFNCCDL